MLLQPDHIEMLLPKPRYIILKKNQNYKKSKQNTTSFEIISTIFP